MKTLLICLFILINIYVFYEGINYNFTKIQLDDHLNKEQNTIKEADKDLNFDKISKTSRKSDNNIRNMFSEGQSYSTATDAKKISASSDDIKKARLVGIIVPLDEVFHKTAIIEYGTPLRTLRLHKGDFIPGTSWKIKTIGDREIAIENSTTESKMSFK